MMRAVYEPMHRIVNALGTSHGDEMTEEAYQGLPAFNLSHAVLERSTPYLSVMPVPGVYQSDWGDEFRIRSDVAKSGCALIPDRGLPRRSDRVRWRTIWNTELMRIKEFGVSRFLGR
jgi:hypothetical protein